jgi:hypothetical protein
MKLNKWQELIQQIVDESNGEPKESGKHKVLMNWRATLAKEPHLMQLYQIDEIVREVQRRLTNFGQHQPTDRTAVAHSMATV